jgi:FkbM family methyltransferase
MKNQPGSRFYFAAKLFGITGFIQIVISKLLMALHKLLNKLVLKNYAIINALLHQGVLVSKKNEIVDFCYKINDKDYSFSLIWYGSDLQVFEQLMLHNEYVPAIEILNEFGIKPSTMIDAGANIGLATIYFKAFFPDLSVLAIEPSTPIYVRAKTHFDNNQLTDVTTMNAAVWCENTRLQIDNSFGDGEDWATRTIQGKDEQGTVDAFSIPTLLAKMNWQQVDILKMDIEGAESDVFRDRQEVENWLGLVQCLIIEIHDEFNCRNRIEHILKENQFKLFTTHEYTVAINGQLVKAR